MQLSKTCARRKCTLTSQNTISWMLWESLQIIIFACYYRTLSYQHLIMWFMQRIWSELKEQIANYRHCNRFRSTNWCTRALTQSILHFKFTQHQPDENWSVLQILDVIIRSPLISRSISAGAFTVPMIYKKPTSENVEESWWVLVLQAIRRQIAGSCFCKAQRWVSLNWTIVIKP